MNDVLIVYWSGSGNTEIMAEKIKEGLEDSGLSVDMMTTYDMDPEDVSQYKKIAMGCPSYGDEELEEYEFLPFFEDATPYLKQTKLALFGSFGAWGDGLGRWMDKWQILAKNTEAILFDQALKIVETPDDADEELCINFGKAFADF